LFLFVGKDLHPATIFDVFGVQELSSISLSAALVSLDASHNRQIRFMIEYLRRNSPRFMKLNICRQGLDAQDEARFAFLMVEDAKFDNPSYADYIVQIHRAIEKEL
jgi:hypothetical protein